jgi:hypothetical protein
VPPDVGPAFFVLGHEDVEGGLWESLRVPPPLHSFVIGHPLDFLA